MKNHILAAPLRICLVFLFCLYFCAPLVQAADYRKFEANQTFFSSRGVSNDLMTFAHPSATLKRLIYVGSSGVKDSKGKVLPGEYTLQYDYHWHSSFDGENYVTRVTFFFDARGALENLNATTAGSFIPPFGASSLSAGLLVELIGSELKESDSRFDRSIYEGMQNSSDTRKLTLFLLHLQQHKAVF